MLGGLSVPVLIVMGESKHSSWFLGSTKAQVLAAEGTPRSISWDGTTNQEMWGYGAFEQVDRVCLRINVDAWDIAVGKWRADFVKSASIPPDLLVSSISI